MSARCTPAGGPWVMQLPWRQLWFSTPLLGNPVLSMLGVQPTRGAYSFATIQAIDTLLFQFGRLSWLSVSKCRSAVARVTSARHLQWRSFIRKFWWFCIKSPKYYVVPLTARVDSQYLRVEIRHFSLIQNVCTAFTLQFNFITFTRQCIMYNVGLLYMRTTANVNIQHSARDVSQTWMWSGECEIQRQDTSRGVVVLLTWQSFTSCVDWNQRQHADTGFVHQLLSRRRSAVWVRHCTK